MGKTGWENGDLEGGYQRRRYQRVLPDKEVAELAWTGLVRSAGLATTFVRMGDEDVVDN